jgi:8-oxo-dGTP pyrophosphatase MutT (NUDIX family)
VFVRNEYRDGSLSRPYRFEMVERRGVDSVAVIPYFRERGKVWVVLKAGFRPALFLRSSRVAPGEPRRHRTLTVEAVAGSLQPGETSRKAVDRRAVREVAEETGFRVTTSDLLPLGAGFFPSHGQCTEKIHLRTVRVDPERVTTARGDGSVNEAETWTLIVEARDALRRCRRGEIEDPKVEIGVGRLIEVLRRER